MRALAALSVLCAVASVADASAQDQRSMALAYVAGLTTDRAHAPAPMFRMTFDDQAQPISEARLKEILTPCRMSSSFGRQLSSDRSVHVQNWECEGAGATFSNVTGEFEYSSAGLLKATFTAKASPLPTPPLPGGGM